MVDNSYEGEKQPWRRLLWLKQDEYPDNYTDPGFTDYLENLKEIDFDYDYERIRSDFLKFYYLILNTCFIFITFSGMYEYEYDPKLMSLVSTLTICAFNVLKYHRLSTKQLKSSVIIIFTILTLSPVLKSLSQTTSTDSIWVISFWLTIYYLFSVFKSMTSDSKMVTIMTTTNKSKRVRNITYSKNLPTNILLANVAMLSSRLPTTTHVFCFLLICIEINIILPKLLDISKFTVSLVSNLIVYTYINISWGVSTMIIFGIFTIIFTNILPRVFWYWETHYKCKTPEILSLWDTKTPILA